MPGRKYDNGSGYRYGFNAQEKSDEIAKGLTTALYWEYDSRIGRRWNTDPKPNAEISPYASFYNSPLWFNDKMGDTPRVWVHTPTAADPNSITQYSWYKRKDGAGFYDENHNAVINYDALVRLDSKNQFLKDVNGALIRMYITTPGKKLIDDLNKPGVGDFFISPTTGGNSTSSGVAWNPLGTKGGMDERGQTTRPAFIGLGHELKHQLNILMGVDKQSQTWATTDDSGNPLIGMIDDDITATHFENQLRAACGLPLRTHYSYDASGSAVETTRIIKRGTRESIYVDSNENTSYTRLPRGSTPYTYPR